MKNYACELFNMAVMFSDSFDLSFYNDVNPFNNLNSFKGSGAIAFIDKVLFEIEFNVSKLLTRSNE